MWNPNVTQGITFQLGYVELGKLHSVSYNNEKKMGNLKINNFSWNNSG